MYATVVQCDMHAIDSSFQRGRVGRVLATRLSRLPGFVAFIALDCDADPGQVAALCIFEDPDGIETAGNAIELWQQDYPSVAGSGVQRLGTGAVIVQKGM